MSDTEGLRERVQELEDAAQRCIDIIDSRERNPKTDAELRVLSTLVQTLDENVQAPPNQ